MALDADIQPKRFVMTDYVDEVLENLKRNVLMNIETTCVSDSTTLVKDSSITQIECYTLDWFKWKKIDYKPDRYKMDTFHMFKNEIFSFDGFDLVSSAL